MFFIFMSTFANTSKDNRHDNQLFTKQLRELVGYFAGIENSEAREDVIQMIRRVAKVINDKKLINISLDEIK